MEREPEELEEEPGLRESLLDRSLSGEPTAEELRFLKGVRFRGKRPAPLCYDRELQDLGDPLHFRADNRSLIQDSPGGANGR